MAKRAAKALRAILSIGRNKLAGFAQNIFALMGVAKRLNVKPKSRLCVQPLTKRAGASAYSSVGAGDAGFTLLEMMMVLLIIGLMSTGVLLAIPDKKPEAQNYVENLVRRLNQAAQNSMISGQPAGLGLTRDGYTLYSYDNEIWAAIHSQDWPENINLRYEKDNRRLELPKEALPVILFEPTGQSDIFALSLSQADKQFSLYSQGDSRIYYGEKP